jgi:hypothetical protein
MWRPFLRHLMHSVFHKIHVVQVWGKFSKVSVLV